MHPSGLWVPIVLFVMIGLTSIGVPIARAFARRIERGGTTPPVPPDLSAQIQRLEQAVDSIAIEVERISEGQRFTTRLLAERQSAPGAAPPAGGEGR